MKRLCSNLRRHAAPVFILTNAPRPSSIIPPQLDRLGLSREAYDGVVTSGDATRAAIRRYLPAPAYRLGPDKDDALYGDLDISFTTMQEAAFIVCTGMVDDHHDQPEQYRDLLAQGVKRKLPMICANPDIVVNWGGRMIYCAGALAEIYENLGGVVIYGGKPHRPIYDLAMKEIEKQNGAPIAKASVLAVGDGVKTDIGGANAHGIDALFIAGAGGIHHGAVTAENIETTLRAEGVDCVAAMEMLVW